MGSALGTVGGARDRTMGDRARRCSSRSGSGASAIPIIAFAPIAINWFGLENPLARMAIVALMVFFPIMVNTVRGLTERRPGGARADALATPRRREVLRKVRIPNALPYWFTALRIAATLSVIGAVVGEYFGVRATSLGIYVTNMTGAFRYPNAWAAIVRHACSGSCCTWPCTALERVVVPWQRREVATT